jgi:hypothetical protein
MWDSASRVVLPGVHLGAVHGDDLAVAPHSGHVQLREGVDHVRRALFMMDPAGGGIADLFLPAGLIGAVLSFVTLVGLLRRPARRFADSLSTG